MYEDMSFSEPVILSTAQRNTTLKVMTLVTIGGNGYISSPVAHEDCEGDLQYLNDVRNTHWPDGESITEQHRQDAVCISVLQQLSDAWERKSRVSLLEPLRIESSIVKHAAGVLGYLAIDFSQPDERTSGWQTIKEVTKARGVIAEMVVDRLDDILALENEEMGITKPSIATIELDCDGNPVIGYKLPAVPAQEMDVPFYRQYISPTNGRATDYLMAYLEDMQTLDRKLKS